MRLSRSLCKILLFLLLPLLIPGLVSAAVLPTFKEATGHDFGERITEHHQMIRYLEMLDRDSPRVRILQQGESWEGRSLTAVIVTSPENHARLDEIRRRAQLLGDPRILSSADASNLIDGQPVIVWIGGSIHGFELSGAEGALKLLEHLATRDDAATMEVLGNSVIVIDPMLNPDGRDAHAQYNHQRLGRVVSPEPDDWTNDYTGWESLSYRTGHYFFDTNRDWFAHTQRESRARVRTIRDWRPQVGVDAHEMGADVEFYFDPPTDPASPFFPEYATRWFEVFGKAHADAFDESGFEYTMREMFNYFYPAYTTSFLSYQGAIGMLYEQGTSRGLAIKRSDGSVRTLSEALEQQYVAMWALVRTAARERRTLLQEYYQAHRAAIEEGKKGTRRYYISREGDPYHVTELVNLLIRNGIEVSRLNGSVQITNAVDRTGQSVRRITLPEGSYMIEASQPRTRLIRALFEPHIPIPHEFLEAARERIERAENPRFYDITAYSLPLLFNVPAFGTTDSRSVSGEQLDGEIELIARLPRQRPRYAYLIDGRQSLSLTAAYYLREQGYRVGVMTEPTSFAGNTYARGTVVVRTGLQPEGVHDAVAGIAEKYGLEVGGIDTGQPDRGFTAPGSPTTIDLKKPEIALLAEFPVFAYSFGWNWFTLDRQYEIPHTILRARSLRNNRIDRFDVIVLPAVSGTVLQREIGTEGIDRLKRWVQEGGTLVTISGSATDFAREQLELTKLRSWYDADEGENKQRFSVPGAILRGETNQKTWLTVGYGEEIPLLLNSDRLYLPSDEPPSQMRRVAVRFPDTGQVKIAGHVWDETIERIPGTVFAYEERIGSGRVIAFSEDISYRAYWRGGNRLFLNAVVLGPSAP